MIVQKCHWNAQMVVVRKSYEKRYVARNSMIFGYNGSCVCLNQINILVRFADACHLQFVHAI